MFIPSFAGGIKKLKILPVRWSGRIFILWESSG